MPSIFFVLQLINDRQIWLKLPKVDFAWVFWTDLLRPPVTSCGEASPSEESGKSEVSHRIQQIHWTRTRCEKASENKKNWSNWLVVVLKKKKVLRKEWDMQIQPKSQQNSTQRSWICASLSWFFCVFYHGKSPLNHSSFGGIHVFFHPPKKQI